MSTSPCRNWFLFFILYLSKFSRSSAPPCIVYISVALFISLPGVESKNQSGCNSEDEREHAHDDESDERTWVGADLIRGGFVGLPARATDGLFAGDQRAIALGAIGVVDGGHWESSDTKMVLRTASFSSGCAMSSASVRDRA